MKFGLSEQVVLDLVNVFSQYKSIRKVVLYGSRAKGNFKEGSDIDIALDAPDLSPGNLAEIETRIDDLLLPYKIDLSLFHTIESQSLLEHISRVGIEFN